MHFQVAKVWFIRSSSWVGWRSNNAENFCDADRGHFARIVQTARRSDLPADVFRLMQPKVQESEWDYVDARRNNRTATQTNFFRFVMSAHLRQFEVFSNQLMEIFACQYFASAWDVSDFLKMRLRRTLHSYFRCWCRWPVPHCLVTPILERESNRNERLCCWGTIPISKKYVEAKIT